MKINDDFIYNALKDGSRYFPELGKISIVINKTGISITKDNLSLLFNKHGILVGASSRVQ